METKHQKRIIIAAIDNDFALGNQGQLLYRLPGDLQHFKKLTQGHVVIMGRKTYESIGKPLSNRINVVVSQTQNFAGVVSRNSLENGLRYARLCHPNKDVFLIGGAMIYKEALDNGMVDEMYLTHIDATSASHDVEFPFVDLKHEWELVSELSMTDNGISYIISHYVKM